MALTIDAERSPRLIFVDSATNEVTVQELIDELRDWEDDPGRGMAYPRLILAAGKEPLGGGVQVGITATLQNARLAFSPDPTTTSTGSATSNSANGETLIDTAAPFQTDGVTVGANVTNGTTGAFGTVLSIDSETQLTLRTLNGGTRQDFQIGDTYYVHNVVQKSVSGGNLVAVDANGADLDSIYPTAYTQVVRTSSSSATLLNQFALEHGSFDGAVWVKSSSPYSGSQFPTGTLLRPVNNMADALTIAINEGFSVFNLLEAVTIPATGDFSNKAFRGPVSATPVTVAAGAQVDNCDYEVLQLSGQLSGSSLLRDCLIGNVTGFNGIMENCVIAGSVVCSGSSDTLFVNCYSSVDVTAVPTVSLGGASGPDMVFRGYVGDIRLTDLSRAAAKVSLDFASGDLILDPTIVNGTIVARGIGTVADNSTAPAVVQSKILNADNVNNSLFDGGVTVDALNGAAGTEFPLGTRSAPVDNLADAETIAANESLNEIRFIGNYTFGATDVLDSYVIRGEGVEATLFTLTAGVSTDNTLFLDADVTGTLGGYTRVRDCELKTSVSNMEGLFENCIFRVGTYTLVGDNTKLFVANNCKSGVVTGQPQPIFDCNGDGASFITRAWSGPYKVINKTNNVSGICFDFISGKLVLDSTITAGHFPVRGTVYVLNNMTGTATAELEGVGSAFQNADFVWDEPSTEHATADTTGLLLAETHGQIRRGVFVNTEEATNGNGYQQTPFNNWSDAVDAAETELLQTLYLEADATVDRNLFNFEILGLDFPSIDLAGFDYKNTIIRECDVTGAQGTGNNPLLLLTCNVTNVSDFNGSALTITAVGSVGIADGAFTLINGLVPFVGGAAVTIDMQSGAAGSNANFQNLSGEFSLTNVDDIADVVTMYFVQGRLTIDATCTAGSIIVGGNVEVIDNSGSGCTVTTTSTVSQNVSEAVGSRVIESTYTADEVMKILAAALAGKVSGAGSGTETFKGLDGTTDRIVSTVDVEGNRTAVVADGT
jgi:hypothetical protein